MKPTPLLADLQRALDLLSQADGGRLDFSPDPNVSPDVRALTGIESYPVESHRANLRAREDAHYYGDSQNGGNQTLSHSGAKSAPRHLASSTPKQ